MENQQALHAASGKQSSGGLIGSMGSFPLPSKIPQFQGKKISSTTTSTKTAGAKLLYGNLPENSSQMTNEYGSASTSSFGNPSMLLENSVNDASSPDRMNADSGNQGPFIEDFLDSSMFSFNASRNYNTESPGSIK